MGPTMLDPKTRLRLCIACEVLTGTGMPLVQQLVASRFIEGEQTATALTMHATHPTNVNNKEDVDITRKMVDRIMEGWSVVEGSQCPSCSHPLMCEPKTHLTHCVTCGVLTPVQLEVAGPTSENTDPNPHVINPSSRAKHAIQNKLRIEIAREKKTFEAPDPTASMSEFRSQYGGKAVDPDEKSENKFQATQQFEPDRHHPLMNRNGQVVPNELYGQGPTPNILAIRKKPKACDPSPNMETNRDTFVTALTAAEVEGGKAVQHTTGNPTPAVRTLYHNHNEPTPTMQSVWNRRNEPSYHSCMHTRPEKLNDVSTHPAKIIGADPTPSNFCTMSRNGCQ